MDPTLTPQADQAVAEIAARHGLSREAVLAMLYAVRAGGGTMAQFAIPELGGSGQWMRGGMTMVGDMFNHTLKARVDALCAELAQLLATTTVFRPEPAPAAAGLPVSGWWPADLGVPSSTGSQNNARYAIFPGARRLVIQIGSATRVFDTGEHRIGGVQQQQGGGIGSVGFTSQLGTFLVSTLPELDASPVEEVPPPADVTATPTHANMAESPAAATATPPADGPDSVVAAIEALAGLHSRGILTDAEFADKKAELLRRL